MKRENAQHVLTTVDHMTEEEKFDKAIEDLTSSIIYARSVMNYLQEIKVSKISFTEIEEKKKSPWWKRIFSK